MNLVARVMFLFWLVAVGLSTGCRDENDDVLNWMESECLECVEAEELALCSNSEDDDEDGLTDCEDPNCEGIGCCGRIGPEDTDEFCNDGCDNDGNGYVDCGDYSCSKSTAVTVCKSEVEEPEDNAAACSDGIDNDWDGYFDCADYSCMEAEDVFFCEGNDQTCSDGTDNDGNGFVDCDDFGCSRNNNVTVCQ